MNVVPVVIEEDGEVRIAAGAAEASDGRACAPRRSRAPGCYRLTGSPAFFQACRPPWTLVTLVKPIPASAGLPRAAVAAQADDEDVVVAVQSRSGPS